MAHLTTVTRICPICNNNNTITVDADKYARWRNDEFAQELWPELSADQRKTIIFGVHLECLAHS